MISGYIVGGPGYLVRVPGYLVGVVGLVGVVEVVAQCARSGYLIEIWGITYVVFYCIRQSFGIFKSVFQYDD